MTCISKNAAKSPDFLLIDLFCGAGGTSTGAEKSGVCKVIAAINHDPLAIKSHAANHQGVLHLTEDILQADITPIQNAVDYWKMRYPDVGSAGLAESLIQLWVKEKSLHCDQFWPPFTDW